MFLSCIKNQCNMTVDFCDITLKLKCPEQMGIQEPANPKKDKTTMFCRVDELLARRFYKLGVCVAQTPGYFLIIPVLLSLLCITGYQRIHYAMDPEYLFSPENGDGKYERAVVESFFKMNYSSRFNPTRITRPGRFGRVIVLPKQGDDLLSVEVWKELRLLDAIIKNATIIFGEGKEKFSYHEICARWEENCFENDILNLDKVMEDVVEGSLNLTFPLMINPVTWDAHIFPVYFGGPVIDDDIIVSVPSLQLAYFVNADSTYQDHRGAAWEEEFLDAVGRAEESGIFQYISTARFASRTLDIELEKNTQSIVPYFGSTFVIMAVFSTLTCMMSDWVRSKPILGIMGNISAAMGTVAGFGLAVYCGIDFIGINLVSPLLMCSIGIDDTFVMLAAWRRTPVTDSVPERLGKTMSDAAVSITITSVTDIISLWIGMLSPFPSIKIFCLYSSFAVAFIFVWHITFFAACVALSGYAEHENRHSIFNIKVKSVSLSGDRSWLYKMFCAGGINPKDPNNPADNPDNMLMIYFRDRLAPFLCWWPVKILILVVFAIYLCGACYGLTTLQEGLQRRKLSKADSYSIIFYDREDFYFREFPYRMQVIIAGEMNYSDPITQEKIETLTKSFEASPFISHNSVYTESWVRSFVGYINRNKDYLNVSIDTEPEFISVLKELWLYKPNPFSLDVKFSDDGSKIIASRLMIQAVNISDGNMEKDMVRDLRRIARESELNVTVFHPYFVFFDQFELVKPTSIQSMIVGAVIMMIISFIFIPNLLCSLWVAFCIISIETGVAGYMALWDVNLDSISMINLIMCIGFSVDFTAHICYAYMSSKEETSEERIKECLYALGLPIFQGAMSTILGVIALVLAQSYIFLVFFKMIFLVILFGALHGMFLLPVLLSLFGPGSFKRKKIDLVSEKFPHPYCIPHPQFSKHMVYETELPGKFITDDKDLGLGTSGEESSESSSSKSQRRRVEDDDEKQRQRYLDGWRRSSHVRSNSYHNGGYLSDEDVRPWRRTYDYRLA